MDMLWQSPVDRSLWSGFFPENMHPNGSGFWFIRRIAQLTIDVRLDADLPAASRLRGTAGTGSRLMDNDIRK
jgi:hypothetical protein